MSHPHARLTVHGRALLCQRIEGDGWRTMDLNVWGDVVLRPQALGDIERTAGF